MLAPGGRAEKLIERELIHAANAERTAEQIALVRGGAVLAGQVVALSLGADPGVVQEWSRLLLEDAEEVTEDGG